MKACLPRVCKPVLLKAFPTQVLFESCHRWCVHALCIMAHLAPLCSRHKTHFYAFCGRRCQTVNLSYLDLASFRCRWADRSRWTSTTGNKKHILRPSGNNTSHILFPIFHILRTWRAIWVESLSARGHNKRWFARPFSAGRMHKGIHSCGKQAPAASDQASREMYKLDWEPRQKVWQGGGR